MKKTDIIKLYPIDWTPEKIQAFRHTLLDWYDNNKRDLPWRRTKDPYKIWVSEIMLQQTQVDTVIPYYNRFIEELPTIKALAQAPEDQIMSLWQGLGYYSRVRNMQTAAQQIMRVYQGVMPQDLEGLLSLKGIGPYTAGAIASMAFDLPEPALDGNLMRIVARMFELDYDITKVKSKRIFMSILYQLIDPDRPGDFNQALMDLGATIMTPTNYIADESPIKAFDLSYHHGTAHLYPVKKAANKASHHYYLGYYIQNEEGAILLRKHQTGELLKGLWHFPLVEQAVVLEGASPDELIDPLKHLLETEYQERAVFTLLPKYQQYGTPDKILSDIPVVQHVFSHRVWHVQLIPLKTKQNINLPTIDYKWVAPDQLANYPVSTLQQKLFKQVIACEDDLETKE